MKAGPPASPWDIPRKSVDFGYRAAHEMTVASKAIATSFYGKAPKLNYWNGCSAGGRSALMEAQRYPTDFDGIIAGSPGLDWTGPPAAGRLDRAGSAQGRSQLHPARQVFAHPQCRRSKICDAARRN